MAKRTRKSVRDRSVLITGAASGIGRAAARAFHAAGAHVAMLDVKEEALAAAVAEIKISGTDSPQILPIVCDLKNRRAGSESVEQVLETWGTIDVLINNAGLVMGGPFHEGDPERMHDVIEVNLYASLHLTRLVLPHMIERGSGHILNMVSSSADLGVPGFAVYAATKSGLMSFTRILRRELAGTGIRLTTLCPGSTATAMTQPMIDSGKGAAALPHHAPEVPAAAILDAVVHGREHIAVTATPRQMTLVSFLDRLFPNMMNRYWERQVEEGGWLDGARHAGEATSDT